MYTHTHTHECILKKKKKNVTRVRFYTEQKYYIEPAE